jgi:hypothetical protein
VLLTPIRVDVETRRLKALEARMPTIVARTINRSAGSARTAAGRAMAADLGLPVGEVRSRLRLERAKPEAEHLFAELSVRGRPIPLIRFGAKGPEPSRGRGRGVTVRTGSGRIRLAHAFIATMPRSKHRGVFQRVATKRLPIVQLFGPSLPDVFAKPEIVRTIKDRYAEVFPKNLQHELDYELSRLTK